MKIDDIVNAMNAAAEAAAAPADHLPPLPAVCECGSTEFQHFEYGYCRASTAYLDGEGDVIICTDGWDDMSDGGLAGWFVCYHCGEMFSTDGIEQHWN